MVRNCQHCGKFTTNDKYCSRECFHGSRGDKVEVNCDYCGEAFEKWESQMERGKGKYCSTECMGKGYENKVERTCQECGETFKVQKSVAERGADKHCSRDCRDGGRIERECQECGKTFDVKASAVDMGWGKYCSNECHNESQRLPEALRGESNYGPLWRDRRWEAIVRDNFECQDCGLTMDECRDEYNTGLHVHHIEPYRTFDSDEEAHRLDNLVTLCPPCHREREAEP